MTISEHLLHQKYNQELMKRMRLKDYLNEWGEDLPQYGSVVTEVIEKSKELKISVMDWSTSVCDPASLDSAPFIKMLTLTPGELRLKGKEKWDADVIEALIEANQESRKNLKGETVNEDPAHITVYEVHGLLSNGYLSNGYLKAKPTKKTRRPTRARCTSLPGT